MLAHGTLVAINQGEGMWPMFAFEFGGIFVITQMHGLGWSRPVRALVLAAYVAGVLVVYAPLSWGRLSEVLRIPCSAFPDRLRCRVRPGRHHRRRARRVAPARRNNPIGGRTARGLSRAASTSLYVQLSCCNVLM